MPPVKLPPEVSWSERRYRRMGAAYLWLFPGVITATAVVNIAIGSLLSLLLLDLPSREFPALFGRALAAFGVWLILFLAWGPVVVRPVVRWVRGFRDIAQAPAVWRSATGGLWRLILVGIVTFTVCCVPLILYVNRSADLPGYGILLIAVGIQLVIGGVALVNYFVFEALARPILRDVSRLLPPEFEIPRRGAGLTVKVLAASVVITAYAGILLIGATSRVEGALPLLGVGTGILLFVTLTLALPLSALLARSVVSPVEQLVLASRDVREGRLNTRVPLTSSDEVGSLSQSFNEMVKGLRERAALHSAMGAYVDPVVAQRVLEEGSLLEGVEADVTVLFLDIRDFTSRSERMSAVETVAFLNSLFEPVVGWSRGTAATSTSSSATACSRCSGRRSSSRTTRRARWPPRVRSRATSPGATATGSASGSGCTRVR